MVLVKDGQTGFQAVEAEAPSLAIFDIALLGEQAIECCRSIKQDALLTKTPVLLVMPENADGKMADDCWSAGTDAVVHRPLEASRFLDAAFGLIGISRNIIADVAYQSVFNGYILTDNLTFVHDGGTPEY